MVAQRIPKKYKAIPVEKNGRTYTIAFAWSGELMLRTNIILSEYLHSDGAMNGIRLTVCVLFVDTFA
jgi:hypothetical protein